MEQIKKAISKSKTTKGGTVPTQAPVRTEEPGSRARIPAPAAPVYELSNAHLENNRIVAHEPKSPETAAYDILRTRVHQKMRASNWQTIGITSPRAACGKTVTSINLSFSFARQPEQSIALLDFDLRLPAVAKTLGFQPRYELIDVIEQNVSLTAALVRPSVCGSQLRVLPNLRAVQDSSNILPSKQVDQFIQDLRTTFSNGIIVVDLPPVLVSDEVIAMIPHLDYVLLIAAAGQTTPAEIEQCEQLLAAANSIDIVLNKAAEEQHGYSY